MMLKVVKPAKPSDLKGLVVVLVVSFDLPTTSDPNFARASYENTSLERILDSADGLTPCSLLLWGQSHDYKITT